MLTFNQNNNIKIASITGGKLNNKKLYISDDNKPQIGEYEEIMKISNNVCKYCDKKLSRKDHLLEHYNVCKNKIIDDTIKKVKNDIEQNIGNELLITDDGIISPEPLPERETIYIYGKPKSGKSTWIGKYVDKYINENPKKNVYLFSFVEKDRALSNKKIKRVKIDDTLLTDPITIEELRGEHGCLAIFDDIIDDTAGDKLNKYLWSLMQAIIRNGRDHEDLGRDISIMYTSHTGCNGQKSKLIIKGSTAIVFFIDGHDAEVDYMLNKYYGIVNKHSRDRIMKLPTRWVTIYKNRPSYLLHEKGAIMMKNI